MVGKLREWRQILHAHTDPREARVGTKPFSGEVIVISRGSRGGRHGGLGHPHPAPSPLEPQRWVHLKVKGSVGQSWAGHSAGPRRGGIISSAQGATVKEARSLKPSTGAGQGSVESKTETLAWRHSALLGSCGFSFGDCCISPFPCPHVPETPPCPLAGL